MTETKISARVPTHILRHVQADGNGTAIHEDTIQFQIGEGTYLELWNEEVDLNE